MPINSYLHEQIGETRSLPNMAQWGHFVVHKDEIVLLYSEDQRASFYLYKLPEAWRPYCVFRWPASGKSLGLPSRRRSYFAARVVPMGFAGSVPIMQDVGQALATAPPPLGAGISLPLVRGDRAFPLALPLGEWEVQPIYLDNWDSLLICPESQRLSLVGVERPSQKSLRRAWARAGVLRSADKALTGVVEGLTLGAAFDGVEAEHGASPARILETILYNLVAACSDTVSQLFLQVVLGKNSFCLQFRRPLYSILGAAFKDSSHFRSGPVTAETADELLVASCALAGCVVDWRAWVDPVVACSDASETGGGSAVSVGLTDFAKKEWAAQLSQTYEALQAEKKKGPISAGGREGASAGFSFGASGHAAGEAPGDERRRILWGALFDGVGGTMQALSLLKADVVAYVSVEADSACRRVARSRFSVSAEYNDVRDISIEVVARWARTYGSQIDMLVWAAGSPCVDLSSLKGAAAAGLGGSASGLFFEVPRVRQPLGRGLHGARARGPRERGKHGSRAA